MFKTGYLIPPGGFHRKNVFAAARLLQRACVIPPGQLSKLLAFGKSGETFVTPKGIFALENPTLSDLF